MHVSEEEIQKEKLAVASKGERRRAVKKRRLERDEGFESIDDCDDNFSFIAGYTSGGFAYGVAWEEEDQLHEAYVQSEHLL
ncbi:MAG: hypothetical protein AUJ56_13465 [Zetaproteobacteria bacterium CG1_02_49_23]|nr:MAG: hypothetical protein AUJ56_13465 [Zetaproteobacteria bacterium CG1_02_49_23]